MPKVQWDTVFTGIMALAAVVLTGFVLSERLVSRSHGEIAEVAEWEEHNRAGIRSGSLEAPLVITEFMDFTCPFCQHLAPVIDSLRVLNPDEVSVVFHHFPLAGRSQSLPSAVAAECAREQDRFAAMRQLLFQPSDIGDVPDWEGLAESAGVPDMEGFRLCLLRPPDAFDQIAVGRSIGEATGVTGTPTVWVNGRVVAARSVREFVATAAEFGVDLADP